MAGIYIHIPFCKKRCAYCDFFSTVRLAEKERYIDALCREIEYRCGYLQNQPIETLYFGGGTPSLLSAQDFEKIFYALIISFGQRYSRVKEITVEANPDDISPEYIKVLRDLPINRISLGVQSFCDRELRMLNRRHNANSALNAVRLLQNAGYKNISIDLMYGLPGQTADSWKKTLEQAITTGVQHISAYHLTYEKGTRMEKRLREGKIVPVDEDTSLSFFEMLIDSLTAADFEHYEISNFAKKGFRSMHNSSYWSGKHYLGLGASAHSFNGNSRQWNSASIAKYMNNINSRIFYAGFEEIDKSIAYNELIMTRLRTKEGVSLQEVEINFGKNIKVLLLKKADFFVHSGLLAVNKDRLSLTHKGIFVSDLIISDLF